jgi:hypothetical protein
MLPARHTQKRGVQSRPIHAATRDLNRLANQRLPNRDEVGRQCDAEQ